MSAPDARMLALHQEARVDQSFFLAARAVIEREITHATDASLRYVHGASSPSGDTPRLALRGTQLPPELPVPASSKDVCSQTWQSHKLDRASSSSARRESVQVAIPRRET